MLYESQVRRLFIRIHLTRPLLFPISIQSDPHLVSDVDSQTETAIITSSPFTRYCCAILYEASIILLKVSGF
jgi:hypothetical protein